MFTPTITLRNGDVFTFRTCRFNSTFYDRLQVRLSTNDTSTNVGTTATSVGDYSTLLLDINPSYNSSYPTTWTLYSITIQGLTEDIKGRIAFRYFVENGGLSGTRSDYIGIDAVQYLSNVPDTFDVSFNVNMKNAIDSGSFNPALDTVYLAGAFYNFWETPGTNPNLIMADDNNDSIYNVSVKLLNGMYQYKYYKNSGWYNPEWLGGANREITVSNSRIINNTWGQFAFKVENIGANVSIYPNPTIDFVKISADENFNVNIIDMSGRVVKSQKMENNEANIDISSLKEGIYVVKLTNRENFLIYKIVKQN